MMCERRMLVMAYYSVTSSRTMSIMMVNNSPEQREYRINILTKSSKPSKVPLNSAQALSISDVEIFRRKTGRTLVALHDDPDSGADTLVDQL